MRFPAIKPLPGTPHGQLELFASLGVKRDLALEVIQAINAYLDQTKRKKECTRYIW